MNKKTIRSILAVIADVAAVLFPVFAATMAEVLHFNNKKIFFEYLGTSLRPFLLSVCVAALVMLALTLLLRRAWIGALTVGTVYFLLGAANYFKYAVLGDSLLPWDLTFATDMKGFSDFDIDTTFTPYMWIFIGMTVVYVLFLAFFCHKLSFHPIRHAISAVAVMAVCFVLITVPYVRDNLYPKLFNIYVSDMFFQTDNYSKNGFMPAFIVNLGALVIEPPKGYSEKTLDFVLSKHPEEEAADDYKSPDVILILSEALWDPKNLQGTEYNIDPMGIFDRIAAENHGGGFISTTMGGGTVRPEYETVSGLTISSFPSGTQPYQWYVSSDTWAYPAYFKSLGYKTLAVHTYKASYFNRSDAYPFLGFDEYRGMDELHTTPEYVSGLIKDSTFMSEIMSELDSPSDEPRFIFGITMENHGAYAGKFPAEYMEISAKNPDMSEDELSAVEGFAQGVYSFNKSLSSLYDYVMNRDKETVVVVFGDHLPSLGAEYGPFVASGCIPSGDESDWSYDERVAMHRTPYLVFSNYDTGRSLPHDGEDISPYFLMANVLDYIGAPRNSLVSFLRDFCDLCPVYNPTCSIYSDGRSVEADNYSSEHEMFTYDLTVGRKHALGLLGIKKEE